MNAIKAILVGCVSVAISACTSFHAPASKVLSIDEDRTAKQLETTPDKATVYIIRDGAFAGSANFAAVGVNGKLIGRLSPNNYFRLVLPPGEHTFSVFWALPVDRDHIDGSANPGDIGEEATYSLDPGSLTFLRTTTKGFIKANHTVKQIERQIALDLLRTSRLIRFDVDTDLAEYRAKLKREYASSRQPRSSTTPALPAAPTGITSSIDLTETLGTILGIVLFGALVIAGAQAYQPNYPPPRPMQTMELQRILEAPRPSLAPVFTSNAPRTAPSGNFDLTASKYPGSPLTMSSPTRPAAIESKTYFSNNGTDWRVDGNMIISSKGDRYHIDGNTIYSQTGKRYRVDGTNIYGEDGTRCRVVMNQVLCD